MPIKIHIFIALYFIKNGVVDKPRLELTRKILEQYKYVSSSVKDRATIAFTFLGSQEEMYILEETKFINYTYSNFDQSSPVYYKRGKLKFWEMLAAKINTGMKLAINGTPDIVLWAGSNDFVSLNFFDQIISEYSPTIKQTYGISKHTPSGNVILIANNDHVLNKLTDGFYWDGIQTQHRKHFAYCGAILGMNSSLYVAHPDILDVWCFDEGLCEKNMLAKPNVSQFVGKNIFNINPKTPSLDLNSYTLLSSILANHKLYFKNLSPEMQLYIKDQLKHWHAL